MRTRRAILSKRIARQKALDFGTNPQPCLRGIEDVEPAQIIWLKASRSRALYLVILSYIAISSAWSSYGRERNHFCRRIFFEGDRRAKWTEVPRRCCHTDSNGSDGCIVI